MNFFRRKSDPHILLCTRDTAFPHPKLRILCLHGALGSAATLRAQAAPLVGLTRFADLIFVDAPSLQRGERGWFSLATYGGFEETRAYLASVVRKHGPFDGVLGLSQGAVLASLLVGMGFGFDFSVMFGGFPAQDAALRRVYDDEGRYTKPSLHVYGLGDHVVSPAASKRLAGLFVDPTVIVHG